ncbi:MAG: acyl-CoA dehydrogenase [Rhodospirillaceae bacterium]|jgi:alkylation response protein AidB-like acyl-CoA dehydrogenase|nr:acyl-CoA dehydrogenase [Rhodospirillaceae bacterium]|tara:strand:- start:869 stop:2101 length:1233 start_codon:yes stop_codon:yes gene_type:complete
MDELLPEEIGDIRNSVNRFMEHEVNPFMDEIERKGQFPRDLVRKAGDAGFYGAVFPESVGGTNFGYVAAAAVSEEFARNDVRFAACNNQQGSTCPQCIYAGGTVDQVMKFVPPLLAGEAIGMMSLTEAGGGSDALGNMKTTATRDGDVYRLNGSKMWASMANETDVGVLLAKTDPDAGPKGVTAFIVEPKKYSGFEASPIEMHGLSKALRTNAVFLDNFVVPIENRLGGEGDGFKIVMRALQPGRVTVAAKALGVARACFQDAVAYANERSLRGAPIGKFQMIQSDIAEMAVAIEASRALVYKAAQYMDADLPSNRLAALAKYHASQTAKMVADKAQQIFGGYGLALEYRVSWLKSYADLFFTGEGTANVQKILIAEDALGYKVADRHHGHTGLRDPRKDDIADELAAAE